MGRWSENLIQMSQLWPQCEIFFKYRRFYKLSIHILSTYCKPHSTFFASSFNLDLIKKQWTYILTYARIVIVKKRKFIDNIYLVEFYVFSILMTDCY